VNPGWTLSYAAAKSRIVRSLIGAGSFWRGRSVNAPQPINAITAITPAIVVA